MPGTAYVHGVEEWNRHYRQVGRILMLYGLKQKDNYVKPSNGFAVNPTADQPPYSYQRLWVTRFQTLLLE